MFMTFKLSVPYALRKPTNVALTLYYQIRKHLPPGLSPVSRLSAASPHGIFPLCIQGRQ